MDRLSSQEVQTMTDFDVFADHLFEGVGRVELRRNLGLYVQSRMLPVARKNHQVLGAAVAQTPAEADALRQRLTRATLIDWDDAWVERKLWRLNASLISHARALLIDLSGWVKKGDKSVGVARQYCGEVGKIANSQLIVSTHLAAPNISLPMCMNLYLPKVWAEDAARRAEAHVPDEIEFRTRTEIALEQIDRLKEAGVPLPNVAIYDAEFGVSQPFRNGLRERNLQYIGGVRKNITVLPMRGQKLASMVPKTVLEVANTLPNSAWKTVCWRKGTQGKLSSRFARVRVRPAQGIWKGKSVDELEQDQWLLIEWPKDADEPTHYWLANVERKTSLKRLVNLAKLRWRIERDYQDLKQELGLAQFQGRTWPGLHRHMLLCRAALTYLALARRVSPPEDTTFGRRDETSSGEGTARPPGPLPGL